MIDTKALREERAKLISDAQGIAKRAIDEKRSSTAEEKQSIDKMLTRESELQDEINRYEKLNASESALKEVRSTIGRESKAVETIQRNPEDVALEAYRSYLVHGDDMPADLYRSITISANGTLVPELVQKGYIEYLRNFTDIRQAPVTVIPTSQGNDIPWPTIDDTANSASLTAEAQDVGAGNDPTTSEVVLKSYNITSGIIKVSKQFLQDSVIPVDQWLSQAIAKRIATKQNTYYTTGSGNAQPQGLITGIPAGQVITLANGHTDTLGAGADAAAKAADLLANFNDLIHKVKKVYRERGKTGFMVNDSTVKHLKGFVDSTGRGLWQPALTAGEPDSFMGYPVWVNDDMDAIGVSKNAVVFGNFSNFYIRDVGQIQVDRLMERYAEFLMVGFNGYHRTDSRVMDGNSFAVMKTSAA